MVHLFNILLQESFMTLFGRLKLFKMKRRVAELSKPGEKCRRDNLLSSINRILKFVPRINQIPELELFQPLSLS